MLLILFLAIDSRHRNTEDKCLAELPELKKEVADGVAEKSIEIFFKLICVMSLARGLTSPKMGLQFYG